MIKHQKQFFSSSFSCTLFSWYTTVGANKKKVILISKSTLWPIKNQIQSVILYFLAFNRKQIVSFGKSTYKIITKPTNQKLILSTRAQLSIQLVYLSCPLNLTSIIIILNKPFMGQIICNYGMNSLDLSSRNSNKISTFKSLIIMFIIKCSKNFTLTLII